MAEPNADLRPAALYAALAAASVLVPGVFLRPAAAPPREAPPAPAATAPATTPAPPTDDACGATAARTLGDFLGAPAADARALAARAAAAGFRPDALVVTIPDPTDPPLALDYDRFVQSISLALGGLGLVYDRAALPWEAAPDEPTACRRARPGELLFRDARPPAAPGPRRLLLVLLVPETPTAGVGADTFLRAARTAIALAPPGARPTLPVLGPSFTGGAASLRLALDATGALPDPPAAVHVVTGSATDADLPALLASRAGPPVTFESTVLPDTALDDLFADYLARQHVGLDAVALLTESSTAYGAGVERAHRGRRRRACPTPDDDAAPPPAAKPRPLVLEYPPHISRLRAGYERLRKTRGAAPEGLPSLHTALELPLEGGEARHVPPPRSPFTTYSEDRVLANILTALAAERIRYVGVAATDPLDAVFLTQMLRRYFPDVRLFTLGGDLLFTHPDLATDLRGLLVLSTYPLFTRNQVWTNPARGAVERLQFADTSAEGIYNATIALAGAPDAGALLEYRAPIFDPCAARAGRPPAWLTVVGNGAFWPIDYVVPGACGRPDDERARAIREVMVHPPCEAPLPAAPPGARGRLLPAPHPLAAFLLVASLLALAHAVGYAAAAGARGGRLLRGWWFYDVFCVHPADPDYAREQRTFAFLVLASFVPLQLALAGEALVFWRVQLGPAGGGVAGLALFAAASAMTLLALGALLPACVHAGLRAAAPRAVRGEDRARHLVLVLAALLPSAATVTLAFVYSGSIVGGGPRAILGLARASSLTSGLSPLVPIALLGLGFYLAGAAHLRRVRLASELQERNSGGPPALAWPLPPALDEDFTAIRDGLGGALRALFLHRLWLPVVLALAAWGAFELRDRAVPGFDGPAFDLLLGAGVLLLAVALLLALLHFLWLWALLRRLLRRLAGQPLVEAYGRLPARWARSIGLQLYGRGDTAADLPARARHLDALARMLDALPREPGGLDPTALRAALAAPPGEPEAPEAIEPRLRRAAAALFPALAPLWQGRARPDPAVFGQHDDTDWQALAARAVPDARAAFARAAEDFLAVEIVAWLARLFAQLRNLLALAAGAAVLLLLVGAAYPFQPERFLRVVAWTLVLGVCAAATTVFIQMERDEVLSRIAHTRPGAITWNRNFVTQILLFAILPVVTLITTQFPSVSRAVDKALDPLLRVVR